FPAAGRPQRHEPALAGPSSQSAIVVVTFVFSSWLFSRIRGFSIRWLRHAPLDNAIAQLHGLVTVLAQQAHRIAGQQAETAATIGNDRLVFWQFRETLAQFTKRQGAGKWQVGLIEFIGGANIADLDLAQTRLYKPLVALVSFPFT